MVKRERSEERRKAEVDLLRFALRNARTVIALASQRDAALVEARALLRAIEALPERRRHFDIGPRHGHVVRACKALVSELALRWHAPFGGAAIVPGGEDPVADAFIVWATNVADIDTIAAALWPRESQKLELREKLRARVRSRRSAYRRRLSAHRERQAKNRSR